MIGTNVLAGNTRVRTASGLVRLDQLSGSGPQGPPGEKGDTGDTGTVDTTLFYTKLQTDFALAANRPSAGLGDGAQTYDSSSNVIRNILGTGGVVTHIFHNPTDPEDSRNGALVVNGDGVSGIDPNVATFEDSMALTAISLKKPTTCSLGLDVVNGLIVDQVQATQITTGSLTSSGGSIVGNYGVSGVLTAGRLSRQVTGHFGFCRPATRLRAPSWASCPPQALPPWCSTHQTPASSLKSR